MSICTVRQCNECGKWGTERPADTSQLWVSLDEVWCDGCEEDAERRHWADFCSKECLVKWVQGLGESMERRKARERENPPPPLPRPQRVVVQ